ncbi:carbonic anhydrase [Promicromonospora panici]|uniref:carbonic anhydrase n=1 Tax=Promicromonospora panici TaxID=2219658 RepID=UPI00101C3F5C|nr:carbonic anhydrase family protein [Promicromonospora panici]
MKKFALPVVLLLAPLLASCASGSPDDAASSAPPPAAEGEVHWSYDGEEGPDEWGALAKDFAACETGDAQSPIDLPDHAAEKVKGHPKITSSPTVGESVDTGHTIQLVPDGDASEIEWKGNEFDLAQVHFHMPSEHTVEGKALDAEFHFVHTTESGKVLVLGVLAQEGDAENEAWQPFVDGAAEPGSDELPIDVAAMLPTDPTFEEYAGSLTTPPCTEGVDWVIYHEPIELSAEQIAVLKGAYEDNARPIQPQGDRVAYEGTITVNQD